MVDIKIPSVGESITEVTLARWIKQDGQRVEMDEIIAELESDKATMELTASKGGVLRTRAGEGDTVPVGNVVASIEEGSAEKSANLEGNSVESIATKGAGQGLKAEAEALGITRSLSDDQAGAMAMGNPAPRPEGHANVNANSSSNSNYATGIPSPAASKILTEKGVDPLSLTGTGRNGRITKEDAERGQQAPSPAEKTQLPTPAIPELDKGAALDGRSQRRERLSNLRKTVGRRLVAVKNETAMLTTFNEVDMKPIRELRAKYKDKFKERFGVGLGFMSFFTKAVCAAIREYPAINAMITPDEVVYNDYVDVAIAVSAPKGLVVPVIRDAHTLSFDQIEKAVASLAGKAKDNKLTIEEMTGGTFTITNGGVFGSMLSTPILNPPQSAILGMHNIVERPVAVAGSVVIRPIMYVALSYDHRIIDGRESVGFLVAVKQYLEDPSRLLLGI